MEKTVSLDAPLHFSGLPFPEFALDKSLRLRETRLGDAQEILSLYSDPAITRYICSDHQENLEDARNFIRNCAVKYRENKAIWWAITTRPKDRLIGLILLKQFDFEHRFCSVGYLLAKDEWGKGIAAKALHYVVSFALHELNFYRVEAQVYVNHPASCRVLEKLGFVREGHLRKNFLINGQLEDAYIYGLLKPDYEATRW